MTIHTTLQSLKLEGKMTEFSKDKLESLQHYHELWEKEEKEPDYSDDWVDEELLKKHENKG